MQKGGIEIRDLDGDVSELGHNALHWGTTGVSMTRRQLSVMSGANIVFAKQNLLRFCEAEKLDSPTCVCVKHLVSYPW